MHKTQVFISPEGDHYRTRLTHTLEVAQIARTISRALRLNEDLTEAIALGHDLGHTPFGHTGESALDHILSGGFRHNEQSVRVVTFLEKGGDGLNLTCETLDGILNHRGGGSPETPEGKVVQLADKIGYINHDIDDAVRAGVLNFEDLPKSAREKLGDTTGERIGCLIRDCVKTSSGGNVALSPDAKEALAALRGHMFATVYTSQLQQAERGKIARVLTGLYEWYYADAARMPVQFSRMIESGETANRVICDFIAGMTDRYALKRFMDIYVPNNWD
jgi:dGTPase